MRARYTREGEVVSFSQIHWTAGQIYPHWNTVMCFGLSCNEEPKQGWKVGWVRWGNMSDAPRRFCAYQSPLLTSLFSAWLTTHVDMLDSGQNPAESDCSSLSGVFRYPLLTSWDPTWCTRHAAIDRPCLLLLTARWSLPYEDIKAL